MPLKVNIGLSKKKGLPDYGSLGASCHVEFEMDGGYDNGSSEHFQDAVRRAYGACRQAVESEIAANHGEAAHATESNGNVNGIGAQHAAASVNRVATYTEANGNQNTTATAPAAGRSATPSQVRAIYAIAKRNRVDLPVLLSSQFRVHRPETLSIRDASSLIDQLKALSTSE